MPASNRKYRSVLDFETEEALTRALQTVVITDSSETETKDDWVLQNVDPETTFNISLEYEAKRLMVLKSYMSLESNVREPALDSLVSDVRRLFDVPLAVLSLVDLGRQWFMSTGEEDLGGASVTETARRDAFCSHTIQNKQGLLVVPHALQDVRFRDKPAVQKAPGLRFYAGAALISPEGYNLGALCVIDTKPRPGGLSLVQARLLQEKAALAVKLLVKRRSQLLEEEVVQQQQQQTNVSCEECPSTTQSHEKRDRTPSMNKAVFAGKFEKRRRNESPTNDLPRLPSICNDECDDDCPSNIIIPRQPNLSRTLPDPKTSAVDPDQYLALLVEATLGASVKIVPALQLRDFFPTVSEAQMAAYTMEIVTATRENNVLELQNLYESRGRECLDCFNRFGEGLLNMACRRGFKEIVQFLISDVKLSVRVCDDCGRTPLHDACWNPTPQLEICKWILEQDPTLFLVADKRGYSPFQYARKSDWHIWRQFLYDNRQHLKSLAQPDIVSHFS